MSRCDALLARFPSLSSISLSHRISRSIWLIEGKSERFLTKSDKKRDRCIRKETRACLTSQVLRLYIFVRHAIPGYMLGEHQMNALKNRSPSFGSWNPRVSIPDMTSDGKEIDGRTLFWIFHSLSVRPSFFSCRRSLC